MPVEYGQFPVVSPGAVLYDRDPDNEAFQFGKYSAGAQSIIRLGLEPPVTQEWTIQAWSVSAYCQFQTQPVGNPPPPYPSYGRLGALYGGVMTAGAAPGVGAFSGIPQDSTNITKLWDGGAGDPPWRQLPSNMPGAGAPTALQGTPIQTSQNLGSPFTLAPVINVYMGLWLTPSIINNLALVVLTASYSVTYTVAAGRPYAP